jgi:hypothetical protein
MPLYNRMGRAAEAVRLPLASWATPGSTTLVVSWLALLKLWVPAASAVRLPS